MRRKREPWYEFTFGTKEHPRHPLKLLPALILYLIFVLVTWYWFY